MALAPRHCCQDNGFRSRSHLTIASITNANKAVELTASRSSYVRLDYSRREKDTLLNSCACVCGRATQQVRRIPYQSAHQPEPPEWIGHHSLTVDDRGDGSYSLSYCMEHVGIFECRIQYDDKVIQDGEFTCCVISGTLQWQQYQGTTCTHSGDMVQRKRRVPSHRSWPRRRPIGR